MMLVDELAQAIRQVDGDNSLGAGALAEDLIRHLAELGYAFVPTKGTKEMQRAGSDAVSFLSHIGAESVYRAMVRRCLP